MADAIHVAPPVRDWFFVRRDRSWPTLRFVRFKAEEFSFGSDSAGVYFPAACSHAVRSSQIRPRADSCLGGNSGNVSEIANYVQDNHRRDRELC